MPLSFILVATISELLVFVCGSTCLLLRWGAMDAEAYPEAAIIVLQILWEIGTSKHPGCGSLWAKPRAAAFESLTRYDVNLWILSFVLLFSAPVLLFVTYIISYCKSLKFACLSSRKFCWLNISFNLGFGSVFNLLDHVIFSLGTSYSEKHSRF